MALVRLDSVVVLSHGLVVRGGLQLAILEHCYNGNEDAEKLDKIKEQRQRLLAVLGKSDDLVGGNWAKSSIELGTVARSASPSKLQFFKKRHKEAAAARRRGHSEL